MSQGFKGTVFADDRADDTIEMELTAEQQLGLSRAAEPEETVSSLVESCPAPSLPACPSPDVSLQGTDRKRFRLWPLILVVAVIGFFAALAWWVWKQPPEVDRVQSEQGVTHLVAPPIVPPPPTPAQLQLPPVQMRNPFDAKEIFEFPADTTKADAREAMVKLLLERARNRRTQEPNISRAISRYSGGEVSSNQAAAAR